MMSVTKKILVSRSPVKCTFVNVFFLTFGLLVGICTTSLLKLWFRYCLETEHDTCCFISLHHRNRYINSITNVRPHDGLDHVAREKSSSQSVQNNVKLSQYVTTKKAQRNIFTADEIKSLYATKSGISLTKPSEPGKSYVSHKLKDTKPLDVHYQKMLQVKYQKSPTNFKKFLLIGVMTTKRYINSRAKAAKRTWVKSINGKVLFFSSGNSVPNSDLPIIPLPGVNDTYPPQKKSFRMLEYMYKNYADEYEWFMRVDDDAYIKGEQLELFLRSVNSSKLQFIGQSGIGRRDEQHKIGLYRHMGRYCMGGPGIVFSRETLHKVAENAEVCLREVKSTHEDVELGRCVYKYANVQCTPSLTMQILFYHNYEEPRGTFRLLRRPIISRPITLHPIKNPAYSARLQTYIDGISLAERNSELQHYRKEVEKMDGTLTETTTQYPKHTNALPSSFPTYQPHHRDDVITWTYGNSEFSVFHEHTALMRYYSSEYKRYRSRMIMAIVGYLKTHKIVKRQIPPGPFTTKLNYQHISLNPVHGFYAFVDVSLDYKTVVKKSRFFTHCKFMNVEISYSSCVSQGISATKTGKDRTENNQDLNFNHSPSLAMSPYTNLYTSSRLYFIVPVNGRMEIFHRFLTNYENIALKTGMNSELRIVLYKTDNVGYHDSIVFINNLRNLYPKSKIRIIDMTGMFSRGASLEKGALGLPDNSLLFFVDVDIQFNKESIQRIRRNTVLGQLAYFPIVFSQYSPETIPKTQDCKSGNCHDVSDKTIPKTQDCKSGKCHNVSDRSIPKTQDCKSGSCHNVSDRTIPKTQDCNSGNCNDDSGNFHEEVGAWRIYGYGIVSIYKRDYNRVGRYKTNIRQWGYEDVDFYEKVVKSRITVIRAMGTGLVHAYHTVVCNRNTKTYKMCRSSHSRYHAPLTYLSKVFRRGKTHK